MSIYYVTSINSGTGFRERKSGELCRVLRRGLAGSRVVMSPFTVWLLPPFWDTWQVAKGGERIFTCRADNRMKLSWQSGQPQRGTFHLSKKRHSFLPVWVDGFVH